MLSCFPSPLNDNVIEHLMLMAANMLHFHELQNRKERYHDLVAIHILTNKLRESHRLVLFKHFHNVENSVFDRNFIPPNRSNNVPPCCTTQRLLERSNQIIDVQAFNWIRK